MLCADRVRVRVGVSSSDPVEFCAPSLFVAGIGKCGAIVFVIFEVAAGCRDWESDKPLSTQRVTMLFVDDITFLGEMRSS